MSTPLRDEPELETVVQPTADQTQYEDAMLEMGKVSATQGGFFGQKPDIGAGFQAF